MRQPPKHMAECAPMPERQMHSRTKIVATLGPSTDSIEVLTEMVRAGLDVARVNFSHGKHEEHGRRIDLVHEAARRAGRYVGISAPALTDKDREDIKFACMRGVDYVAVSFPRDAADMNLARELVRAAGGHAHLCAKVERHEAIHNLTEIIDASDVVMVARGDL